MKRQNQYKYRTKKGRTIYFKSKDAYERWRKGIFAGNQTRAGRKTKLLKKKKQAKENRQKYLQQRKQRKTISEKSDIFTRPLRSKIYFRRVDGRLRVYTELWDGSKRITGDTGYQAVEKVKEKRAELEKELKNINKELRKRQYFNPELDAKMIEQANLVNDINQELEKNVGDEILQEILEAEMRILRNLRAQQKREEEQMEAMDPIVVEHYKQKKELLEEQINATNIFIDKYDQDVHDTLRRLMLEKNVKKSRADGLSERKIADKYKISRYKVRRILQN